jgi:transposase-like protein
VNEPLTDYATRATKHRPQTLNEIRDAAQRMAAENIGDHDIAEALGISVEQVRRLIGCSDCGA